MQRLRQNILPAAAHLLILCVGVLLVLGMITLYSASMTQQGSQLLRQQLVWCLLGLVGATLCACTDYRLWQRLAVPLAVVAAVGMLLVFVPGLGRTINGARRWIQLGPVNFQPSELAKLAVIIALAAYAARQGECLKRFKQGVVWPGLLVLFYALLILAGKDYGTALFVCAVSAGLLLVAGLRWRYVVIAALLGGTLFGAAVWKNDVRRERILAWWYPEKYARTQAYQTYQSMLAFGVGGKEGRGLGNGRQKTFVPEGHTDFVLCTLGEEIGLQGTLAVVAAYMLLVICGLAIAERAGDRFGMYLAFGITLMIGLQAFVNLGVVTGLLPNKGLPLPFISYGGSNLLMLMSAVGMLLSVARRGVELESVALNPFSGRSLAGGEVDS